MNHTTVAALLAASFLCHPFLSAQAPAAPASAPTRREIENAVAMRRLAPLVSKWLAGSAEAQDLVEELAACPGQKADLCFLAAQVSVLGGKPTTAIRILDGILSRPLDQVTTGYKDIPVATTAGLWRGTVARHHGDYAVAQDSYERVLAPAMQAKCASMASTTGAIANLYLAEIDQGLGCTREAVNARLELVADAGNPFYSAWASYLRDTQTGGAKQAQRKLKWDANRAKMLPLSASIHMELSAMYYEGYVFFDGAKHMRRRLLELATENRPSQIDREMASLVLATQAHRREEYDAATTHYRRVLDSDGFFAPEAGIYLLKVLRKQGNDAEFRKVAESMATRFPGYAEAVKSL